MKAITFRRRLAAMLAPACLVASCSYATAVRYPPSDRFFVTVGDGGSFDEYVPLGYVCADLFSLIGSVLSGGEGGNPIVDSIAQEARQLGANGVILLRSASKDKVGTSGYMKFMCAEAVRIKGR